MSTVQEATRYLLESHILFSLLSESDKALFHTLLEMRSFRPGEVLVRQGSEMTGMYYLYSGRVRLKELSDGKRVSLGVMEKDVSFGELSLLRPGVWTQTIEIIEPAILFFLPARPVRQILEEREDLETHFKREVGYITLSRRLRGLLGGGSYRPDQFAEILHAIGIKEIAKGHFVFQQGQLDPRLYCIERGEVDLMRQPLQGEPMILDRLGRGALIGMGGALPVNAHLGQPHSALAVSNLTVLVIREKEVAQILQINPALYEQLRQQVVRLGHLEEQELERRQRVEGVDQRMRLSAGVDEEEYAHLLRTEVEAKAGLDRFPLVLQRHENAAAAACLTMIANFYGKNFSLGQMVALTNLTSESIAPRAILLAGEQLGFAARAHALDFAELDKVQLPGIIGWEGYHYAVLFRVEGEKVWLADPGQGIVELSQAQFVEGWTEARVAGEVQGSQKGVFIALSPTQAFAQTDAPIKPLFHFLKYILPFRKYFIDALLGSMVLNILMLASPLFVQTIVDTVVVHKDVALLNMMLGGMVLVMFFRTVITVAQSLLLAHTTARIDMRLMSEFYRHVLSLPMAFFMSREKGEILARFGENRKIRAILAGSTITVFLSFLMIIVYLLMMVGYNPFLAGVACLFIPVNAGITLYYAPRIKALSQELFVTGAKSQSLLIESLNGIEYLKATANEYMARSRWEEVFVDHVNQGYEIQKISLTSNSLNQLVQLASTVTILWLGAHLVIEGEMTIGELMGFQMLLGLVMGPVFQVVQLWNSSQEVRIAIERVMEILHVEPEQKAVVSPDAMPTIFGEEVRGRIRFENVYFSYVSSGNESQVLKGLDLTIEPGDRVALVGPAGCGKSTIAKMILGFNKPSELGGQCTIDGKDIRQQDAFLFSGTVAENIALGDVEPDMIAVVEAARLVMADEFILNLPLGYQTPIGEKGVGLSGGQRQRICIARALYRRPKIMIFDEATSSLDNETEALVQQNINRVLVGRTSVTIAHRLTTILHSDYICYIKDGKVAEKGRHQELIDPEYVRQMGYEGLYYHFAARQFDLPPLK
ncbi:MAG: peptidase domain-containing ABC transporter [Magnetococcus sp. DMHC-6]